MAKNIFNAKNIGSKKVVTATVYTAFADYTKATVTRTNPTAQQQIDEFLAIGRLRVNMNDVVSKSLSKQGYTEEEVSDLLQEIDDAGRD